MLWPARRIAIAQSRGNLHGDGLVLRAVGRVWTDRSDRSENQDGSVLEWFPHGSQSERVARLCLLHKCSPEDQKSLRQSELARANCCTSPWNRTLRRFRRSFLSLIRHCALKGEIHGVNGLIIDEGNGRLPCVLPGASALNLVRACTLYPLTDAH